MRFAVPLLVCAAAIAAITAIFIVSPARSTPTNAKATRVDPPAAQTSGPLPPPTPPQTPTGQTTRPPGVTGDEEAPVVRTPPGPAPDEGMVWIPGGTFLMGNADPAPNQMDEVPRHAVTLDGYWMDATEVTNLQFAQFVEATGYVTVAEKRIERSDLASQVSPSALAAIPEQALAPSSICFNSNFDPSKIDKSKPGWPYQVWQIVEGADWRHPEGPESSIEGRMNHPVVHIAWEDAIAYCQWTGKQLPTEAEWEYAARGGLENATYPWGDDKTPDGQYVSNIWQGEFPYENDVDDGFKTSSPVKTFPANAYGLYDMSGNVWEWCQDWYRPDYYADAPKRNPFGPAESFDPQEPNIPKRVQRGGSFMCSDTYCIGYRVSARMKGDPNGGTFHCGFRCVVRAGKGEG